MTDIRVAVATRHPRQIMTTSLRVLLILAIGLISAVTGANAQDSNQRASRQPVARLLERGPIPSATYTLRRNSPAPSNIVPTERKNVGSKSIATLERRAFDLINAQRVARGQRALLWDAELARLARQHSENMATAGFFNHEAPGGMTMVNRARQQGIRGWHALGENIAYNQGYDDPAGFVATRWMISNKHRENLLNSRWTRSAIGVAIASDGRVFFTQVFIAP